MKFKLKKIDGIDYTYVNHKDGVYLLKELNDKKYIILEPDGKYKKVKNKKSEWFQKLKESKA